MFVSVLHSFTPVHPCSGSYHVFATTSVPTSRNHFYSRHNRTLRCIRSASTGATTSITYLLTDLGEPPRSPPVLYVDNKAMLALCWEHRLEHRTKHIALCYFLACELQQRGQLRLAYVASQANTADIFTKALQPCDHQRFCTMLDRCRDAPSGRRAAPHISPIGPDRCEIKCGHFAARCIETIRSSRRRRDAQSGQLLAAPRIAPTVPPQSRCALWPAFGRSAHRADQAAAVAMRNAANLLGKSVPPPRPGFPCSLV
ncbi:unnamed protein product [Closterium sp. NIES-54]